MFVLQMGAGLPRHVLMRQSVPLDQNHRVLFATSPLSCSECQHAVRVPCPVFDITVLGSNLGATRCAINSNKTTASLNPELLLSCNNVVLAASVRVTVGVRDLGKVD